MKRPGGRPRSNDYQRIRELRDQGHSQAEIARIIGTTQPSVSYALRVMAEDEARQEKTA